MIASATTGPFAGPNPSEPLWVAVVNRGEAALRFVDMAAGHRACHGRPVRSIALYTDPDANAPFVRRADAAVPLGPARRTDPGTGTTSQAYLDHELLLDAAVSAGAEAVWPGWGFVAEDASFADACRRRGLLFVGPSPETMRQLGNKVAAKHVAERAGVPVVPWSGGPITSSAEALDWGDQLGYPLVVKAAAGGGGRGIRIVERRSDLAGAFEEARAEGRQYFGDDTVFLEQAVGDGWHLEAQVLADAHGNVWVVGLRDCSVQRRRQKLLEESWDDGPGDVVASLHEHARTLCEQVGYLGAGTVEFLHDPMAGTSYFMEVNARLQVEHPVTEVTTGLDLVYEQLRVVLGGRLDGPPPTPRGHAIEVRLNAEDPGREFAPAPGRVLLARWPTGPGVRVDAGVAEGDVIPSDFDSMIAKVIAHGATREEALSRIGQALRRCDVVIDGGATNRSFMLQLVDEQAIVRREASTGWVDDFLSTGRATTQPHAELAVLVAAGEFWAEEMAAAREHFLATARRGRPELPVEGGMDLVLQCRGTRIGMTVRHVGPDVFELGLDDGRLIRFGLDRLGRHERRVRVDERRHEALVARSGAALRVEVDGVAHTVSRDEGGIVRASLGGVVVDSRVCEGDEVDAGDVLVVLESMKMETAVRATEPGRVGEVAARPGTQVDAGDVLVRLDSKDGEGVATTGNLDFGPWCGVHPVTAHDRLWGLLMGYDLPAAEDDAVVDEASAPRRLEAEARLLRLVADFWGLADGTGPHVRPAGSEARDSDLLLFLRAPTFISERLDEGFSERLDVVLAYFGARQADTDQVAVADALLQVWRGLSRASDVQRELVALLSRWRREARELLPLVRDDTTALLADLTDATGAAMPAVAETARWVRHRFVNEPSLQRHRAGRREVLDGRLATIAAASTDEQIDSAVRALVREAEPWQSWLPQWVVADPTVRGELAARVLARAVYGDPVRWESVATSCPDLAAGVAHLDTGDRGKAVLIAVVTDLDSVTSRIGASSLLETLGTLDPLRLDAIEVAVLDPRVPDLESSCERILPVVGPDELIEDSVLHVAHARGRAEDWASTQSHWWDGSRWQPVEGTRDLHPRTAAALELWRFRDFHLVHLRSHRGVHALVAEARTNSRDRRTVVTTMARAIGDVVTDDADHLVALPLIEGTVLRCLDLLRQVRQERGSSRATSNDRVVVVVEARWDLPAEALRVVATNVATATRGLDLDQIVLRLRRADLQDGRGRRDVVVHLSVPGPSGIQIGTKEPSSRPVRPLDPQRMLSLRLARRGLTPPHDIVRLLTSPGTAHSDFPRGEFVEMDLVDGRLVGTDRPLGRNEAGVVVGTITNRTAKHPEGMPRVLILSDPSQGLGALGEPECRRILAALDLAEDLGVPVEWYAASSGARVAMDSGTENMDWTARVLARLVTSTQAGAEINIVVTGVNVGAQSYWDAEATMLMHCRGILVMVGSHAMVLTGKTALEYSGGVSAPTNAGIGGFSDVMGPNGQGQYWAPSVPDAIALLFEHYDRTYVVPGEQGPRRRASTDPVDRDVRTASHRLRDEAASSFDRVGDVFDPDKNPDRKLPFDVRSVMRAVHDADDSALERWAGMRDAESAVVWDVHVGGMPVTMIGIESQDIPRRSVAPIDGPRRWTGGTLFPLSSKKIARALNAASGRRPAVVLANLSGFDGSPESMRRLQLEYGAEIGRAVVNFSGPIVFCVLSRYHGGAFVVFSKALNPHLRALAVEGVRASVLGGAPAAAVVFSREVEQAIDQDPRVVEAQRAFEGLDSSPSDREALGELRDQVRSEVRGRIAEEFDNIHSVERARYVGSIDDIVAARDLRPRIVAELERA